MTATFANKTDSDGAKVLVFVGAGVVGNRDCMDKGFMEGSCQIDISHAQYSKITSLIENDNPYEIRPVGLNKIRVIAY